MNDYEILKASLKSINCNFASSQTLLGYTVMIQTNEKVIDFEFDHTGKFLRII